MSKLTPTQQAIASNMGQEKLDSDNLVTLVRRRFLLEEVVMTREQYENYSSDVEEDVFTWDLLKWENAQWEDYEFENTYYSAYEGDITSFTDDVVAFMEKFDGTLEEMYYAYARIKGVKNVSLLETMPVKRRGRGRPRKNPLVQ